MLVVIGVLAVMGVLLVRTVNDHVVGQVDQGLISNAEYYKYRIFHKEFIPGSMPAGEFGQVYNPSGRRLGQSRNMEGRRPIVAFTRPGVSAPKFLTTTDSRLGTVRVLEYPLGGHPPLTLIEGQQINQAIAVSSSLAHLLLVVLPLLAVVLAFLIWQVVGRAMNRVEAIRSSVAHVSNDLAERLPISGSGDELDRLVTTMNEMLDRLEGALVRERQFVADASHELRSPMAALRAAIANPIDDLSDAQLKIGSAFSALQRLELLVDELLTLEASSATPAAPAQRVDLDDLLLSEAAHLEWSKNLKVDVSCVSAGQVLALETDMVRVIENLSSNAAHHALNDVKFTLTEEGGTVRLSIVDDGPGVPEEHHKRIFERFFRVDSDRSRSDGGTGLGLAIVRELVERWGGSISVQNTDQGGACFVVELPAASHYRSGLSLETSSSPLQVSIE